MITLKYKNLDVFEANSLNLENLEKVGNDSSGWTMYFTDKTNNFIMFYPFGEYHGGGQSYLININDNEINEWIMNNPHFENEIREQIE